MLKYFRRKNIVEFEIIIQNRIIIQKLFFKNQHLFVS
jgi:hypothetical protein